MDLTLRRAKGFVQNNRDGKAVLKTPQSKRYRDCQATTNLAKRLECGRFTAALGRAALSHPHFLQTNRGLPASCVTPKPPVI
jgi:hypothetical protein